MSTAPSKFIVPPPVATPRGALWAAAIATSIADGLRRIARPGALPLLPVKQAQARPDHA